MTSPPSPLTPRPAGSVLELALRPLRAGLAMSRPGVLALCLGCAGAADLLAFELMVRAALPWNEAHGIAFAIGVGAALLASTIALGARAGLVPVVRSGLHWILILALALSLRGGVLALLVDGMGCSPEIGVLFGFVASSTVVLVGASLGPLRRGAAEAGTESCWQAEAIWLVAYLALLRLAYGGVIELLHEEGYYWNYAQHLDIGYYDHPPMVAWLVAAFTGLLGDHEWAVRAGALLSGGVAAGYAAALAAAIGGRPRAISAVLLVALLPGFFTAGLLMMPDAPLVACWAAALYYLYRALIVERPGAWYAAGVCVGLGLLSKYTMALLALSVVAYVLASPRARTWLRRPQPYVAALLAALLFAPVIVWNAQRQWVSFEYQSLERIHGSFEFDLPAMIGACAVLLTPVGLLTAVGIVGSRRARLALAENAHERRTYRLLLTLTGLPLAVFVGFSLFRQVKLDWTEPLWLGLLPYMAVFVAPGPAHRLPSWAVRPWRATIGVTLLLYAGAFHYLALGFPGLPLAAGLRELGTGIPSAAAQVDERVRKLREETGVEPMTVCLDNDRLAGWLAFYQVRLAEKLGRPDPRAPVRQTTGNQLLGGDSGMYRFWHPVETLRGRVIEVVGRSEQQVEAARTQLGARPLSAVEPLSVRKHGRELARFWCQAMQLPP
jgi:dolichol-phosphate mannosyltransferase